MGVLHKNEQYEDDMVEILQWLHKYVPNHCTSTDGKESEIKQPVNTFSGGDYLTFERHKGAQSAMQDARTPSTRLEGLIPKIEDFICKQMAFSKCCQALLQTQISLLSNLVLT